jgi:hypothetical protein
MDVVKPPSLRIVRYIRKEWRAEIGSKVLAGQASMIIFW